MFTYPLVKVTDNFWKVCGTIDEFNKYRGQISSGEEISADDLMSVKLFCTTLEGDITQYSYIFSNPEPLVTEMNNISCYRLGATLHLDIQKGEEAMKTSEFQKYLRGTVACTKRLTMATKGCVQLTSKYTYFPDIWFGGVKTSEEVMAQGVNYCGTVKTSHKLFLAALEKLMKDWNGGSYLVKINPIFPGGRPLMFIGYKYNSRKVIGFIAIKGAGITEPGDTYLSRFPEIYSNVYVCPVVRPHLLGRYFNACYAIYNLNRILHSGIVLDKYWVTQNVYFRLAATVAFRMGITDGKLLFCHGISEEIVDNKFQPESITTGRFMTASTITLQLILVDHV